MARARSSIQELANQFFSDLSHSCALVATHLTDQAPEAVVDEILTQFPGPVLIFASRFRLVAMFVITSALLALVIVLIFHSIGWRRTGIDGTVVAVMLLVWMGGLLRILLARIPILILDDKRVVSNPIIGWQQIAEWKDVEFCKLDEGSPGINVLIGARDRSPKRWSDHKLIKVSWYIEINYDPLVRLVTEWRERALQAKG